MPSKNSILISRLDGCGKALAKIEEARHAIAAGYSDAYPPSIGPIKSEAYRALDAAFAAVVELQRATINLEHQFVT